MNASEPSLAFGLTKLQILAPKRLKSMDRRQIAPAPHPDAGAHATAARAARESYGKLVAFLAAKNHDVPGAEDALADAFAGRPRWRNRPE